MSMPRDLVLVRHGESVGNEALTKLKAGTKKEDLGPVLDEFPGHWALTDAGVEDARAAGLWLQANGYAVFDRYLSSDYRRARQTAAHMGLPDARWTLEIYLRERERGKESGLMSKAELVERFGESAEMKDKHSFYWRPENGESIADISQRVHRVLDKLHRDCSGQRVVIACHEETIWAIRTVLERMTSEQYVAMEDDESHEIGNGFILHYTRIHPDTGRMSHHFTHWRLIDPHTGRINGWHRIERRTYTNEELLDSEVGVG